MNSSNHAGARLRPRRSGSHLPVVAGFAVSETPDPTETAPDCRRLAIANYFLAEVVFETLGLIRHYNSPESVCV